MRVKLDEIRLQSSFVPKRLDLIFDDAEEYNLFKAMCQMNVSVPAAAFPQYSSFMRHNSPYSVDNLSDNAQKLKKLLDKIHNTIVKGVTR